MKNLVLRISFIGAYKKITKQYFKFKISIHIAHAYSSKRIKYFENIKLVTF